MKKLILLVLMLPLLAFAAPEPWMKAANPNNLFAVINIDSRCPDEFDTYKDIVEGVLIRARIQPAVNEHVVIELTGEDGAILDYMTHKYIQNGKPFLRITLSCGRDKDAYLYDLKVNFAVLQNIKDVLLYTSPSWGGFGRDSSDGINSELKGFVEGAITDYLKANFDLGEDE